MNLLKELRVYFNEVLQKVPQNHLKVLTLDEPTLKMFTLLFSQMEINEKDVLYIEKLEDNSNTNISLNIKCVQNIIIVKPTIDNINAIVNLINPANSFPPRFNNIYIFFTENVKQNQLATILQKLAHNDIYKTIKHIGEFYLNIYCVNKNFFVCQPSYTPKSALNKKEIVKNLLGICCVMNKRPVIKYQLESAQCKNIANSLEKATDKLLTLTESKESDEVPVLILDRSFDIVSPLLIYWTYQTLTHELFSLTNNKLKIEHNNKEYHFSELNDIIYSKLMYLNFGQLAGAAQTLIEQYKNFGQLSSQLNSITDIKRFVDNYSDFKKTAVNLEKHLEIITEISEKLGQNSFFNLSELQQSIVANFDKDGHFEQIKSIIANNAQEVSFIDCLKLVLLYSARLNQYPTSTNELDDRLFDILVKLRGEELSEFTEKYGYSLDKSCFTRFKTFYHISRTLCPIKLFDFETGAVVKNKASNEFKKFIKQFKTVKDVFNQHKLGIRTVIEELLTRKNQVSSNSSVDSTSNYHIATKSYLSKNKKFDKLLQKKRKLIIFVHGGVCYEEVRMVTENVRRELNLEVVFGSNCVFNSSSFASYLLNYDFY